MWEGKEEGGEKDRIVPLGAQGRVDSMALLFSDVVVVIGIYPDRWVDGFKAAAELASYEDGVLAAARSGVVISGRAVVVAMDDGSYT